MNNIQYVLLMRHAKHTHGKPAEPETGELKDIAASLRKLAGIESVPLPRGEIQADVLTKDGREETVSATNRLKEHIVEGGEGLALAAIFFAETPEAKATAEVARAALDCQKFLPLPLLNPTEAVKIVKQSDVRNKIESAIEELKLPIETKLNAVLFVGHEPMLGWIANVLVGEAHSQVNSEILCLHFNVDGPPVLRWTISPSDEKTLEDLREKVRKKMELAGTMGGFITAGIGFIISALAEGEKAMLFQAHFGLVLLAIGCLFGGVIFYLLTMFSYDSLLMPKRFWRETVAGTNNRPRWLVARPPSPAPWVLYQNMIRVWRWQFMPATYFALYGLFVLGGTVVVGAAHLKPESASAWAWLIVCVPFIAAMAAILPRAQELISHGRAAYEKFQKCPGAVSKFQYVFGPWLGSED